jgi:hypothetical protein
MLKYITYFKSFSNYLFWLKELLKNFQQFWEFETSKNGSFWKPPKVWNLSKNKNLWNLKSRNFLKVQKYLNAWKNFEVSVICEILKTTRPIFKLSLIEVDVVSQYNLNKCSLTQSNSLSHNCANRNKWIHRDV